MARVEKPSERIQQLADESLRQAGLLRPDGATTATRGQEIAHQLQGILDYLDEQADPVPKPGGEGE